MDALIGLFSIIGFILTLIWLFIRIMKKKPKKKPITVLLICLVLFIIALFMPNDSTNNLDKYEWGAVAIEKLQEIGVEEIKIIEVKDRVYNNQILGCDVSIETEKTKLDIDLHAKFKGLDEKDNALYEWSVWSIVDNNDREKVYYDYYEESYGECKPAFNLYDYSTGKILIAADEEAEGGLGELVDIAADMMKVLTDAGYTFEQASDIQKILNTIGIQSIRIYKMTGVATKGLNAVICYPNGLTEQSSRFNFTTDNGILFYAGFLGDDLYDSELGGYLKSYEDVHIPETKIDIDTYTKLQTLAIDNVKNYLNHPSSASFNNFAWGIGRSDDKYKIIGEVEAQNSFGVKDDLNFSVYFVQTDDKFLIEGIMIDGIRVK